MLSSKSSTSSLFLPEDEEDSSVSICGKTSILFQVTLNVIFVFFLESEGYIPKHRYNTRLAGKIE